MKLFKALSLTTLASGSILSVSANEYKFEDIKFDQVKIKQDIYEPKDKLDEYIIKGATYSTKFVPLMNNGAQGNEYTSIMANDLNRLLVDAGFNFTNAKANGEIQKIPFLAQTSVNISSGTESDTSFSINSLMKLGELATDEEGDLKTLAFSQARFATATNADGSTINLGLGIRNRPNNVSMVGANAFWDYRMTDYSDAHSRLGLGGEYFWKDFEFRNNWYMSITDEKDVTIKGTSYKERVVPGWDVELGYRLPNNPELAFFVRGFNWDYKHTQDNSGLEGSVSWQATPHVSFEAYLSNEISATSTTLNTSLPGTDETFFGLRMNITGKPVKFERSNYKKNMITQMTQPVKRNYDILLERSTGTFTNRATSK
ncbi:MULTISPECIES: inverse autotransporter beta domain-containing protein [Prochlorococcus]|uniref:Adhesin-like protein n=1 Tax=Prochlorococcus marinus str. MIT 9116 TaxID=167544 RepID=A0A0A1ZWH4_PROMR|nr:inverse autotransporter beta-barrel domain-containing protein [Prochlorococcus marinus]KGF90547.1 adhesin-like protein [Prochlorococcus marinus str. MIT 9107]KGF93572.1 adhesin-like protein [Prochlorococcus marinus str. MIT 9123]KGF93745.1 adhesin-like protein [Prochlorococcus marinus str. MIT 9116]